ncbi:MAG: hypothetical protein AB7F86_15370 [Bdellovibrionales bacterium]
MATLICSTAHAKRFRNAYVSFELPPNWNCKLEGSEWVCENDFAQKTKEAIIILTAKEVGPSDTLAAYKAHLESPRTLQGRGGAATKSKVYHVKERMISNQMWIDGMHLGSEVGPYFTRYLATVKERIAILITFSAHKQHFSKYSRDFINAVESLRVVASKDTLRFTSGKGSGQPGGGETYGNGIPGGGSAFIDPGPDIAAPQARGIGRYSTLLWIAVLLGAVGLYLYMKAGSPKKKTKRPRKK